MSSNFWDGTHPLAADNDRLYDALVPDMGKADTLQGELLRASNKIGYDWYNNGWGCNNWSGAVIFLERNIASVATKRSSKESAEFFNALQFVHNYSHGEPARYLDDDTVDAVVTTIAEFVTQCVLDNPEPVANEVDMWELNERDYCDRRNYFDEDDEDWDE